MEQNFQTSFIPKKPMIEQRAVASRPIGFFTVISIFLFFTMVVASGGLYFYKSVLLKNITQMQNELKLAQGSFEPAKIVQLQVLDKRLNAANDILNNHIIVSPIFDALQSVTMKTISYTDFSYSMDDNNGKPKMNIKMSGVAVGYQSIALQADLFSGNKFLIDPVFSNLLLDDKGNVTFELNFSVDPDFVNYKKVLETAGNSSSNASITDGGVLN